MFSPNKGEHRSHQKTKKMMRKKMKKQRRERKIWKRSAQTTNQLEAADSRNSQNVEKEATPKYA